MNTLNKQALLDSLLLAQYATDASGCWQMMAQSVSSLANKHYNQSTDNGMPGAAFDAWWRSCSELMTARQVVIKAIHYNGIDDNGDESIELFNHGPLAVDMSGWRINAGNDRQDVVFPDGWLLQPQTSIVVDTIGKTQLSFSRKQSVWNNKGDQGLLFDSQGLLVSSWVYGAKAYPAVNISYIEFDGQVKQTEADEYVEITNVSSSWVDVSGWQLNAGKNQCFSFSKGSSLCPGGKIRIYTDMIEPQTGGYSFNSKRAVWNNKGDTALLTDYQGKLVSSYSYGDAKEG